MLVKDGKQGGPETLSALAIEPFDVRLKLGGMQFAEFNMGNALVFSALVARSVNRAVCL